MDGNVLRTDNFHHLNLIKYRSEDFEKNFRYYSEENSKGNLETILLYDVALLFIRLLTGEFILGHDEIEKKFFVAENKEIHKDCLDVLFRMLDCKIDIRESLRNFLKIYKNHVFSLFLDEKDCSLYKLISDYTYAIHRFLQSLSKLRSSSKISRIKINLILGYFVLFLRNIVTMPINYSTFSREHFIWVEEVQQESDLYQVYYDIYNGTLSIILEDHSNNELKKALSPLMSDFNKKNIFSLRQVETIGQSYTECEIDFKRYFIPFKNYEKDSRSFRNKLEQELTFLKYY